MNTTHETQAESVGTAEQALYVYCFARPGSVDMVDVPGVSGAADVRTLEHEGIAAVVSPLSLEEFLGGDGADHTQDLEWVAPRAIRHEAVVEEVMRASPVLPVSFGAVFSSPAALEETIRTHAPLIAEFLEKMADKQEWAVKVYADNRRVREHLERAPEFLQRLERLPASPGARYIHEKRLRRELEGRVGDEARRMAARVRKELAEVALEVLSLRLSDRALTGRLDDMVANDALLVRASDVDELVARVNRLAEELAPRGLSVEASGPWPPYSYCPRLEVQP